MALSEEMVEEVLLRFPPDDPASLLRAALVCKPWCRLISGSRFRSRFRELHRAAPMLGFCYVRADEPLYKGRILLHLLLPHHLVPPPSCGPPLLGGHRLSPRPCPSPQPEPDGLHRLEPHHG
ncbi:hypothetical protein ACP70R_047848 [Stipagrostis hirtigluma subsp. patula]